MVNCHESTKSIIRGLIAAAFLAFLPFEAQSQWYVDYQRGLDQMDKGQWRGAIQSFQSALNKRDKPDLRANTYALNYIEYLPHYHLGQSMLFLGEYAGAMRQFDRSLEYGVIKKSRHLPAMLRMREMATLLMEQGQRSAQSDLRQDLEKSIRDHLAELLLASYQRGQGTRGRDLDSLLAQLQVDAEVRRRITNLVPQGPAPELSTSGASGASSHAEADSASAIRNAAIAAYLQSRYRDSAALFKQLAAISPNEPSLADWQRRLHFELSRLEVESVEPAARIDTVMVVHSSDPMLSILAPRTSETRIRRTTAQISGVASDDIGISGVEVFINGQRLELSDGNTQLRPTKGTDGNFPFEVEVGLQLGENQIAVTAYDSDTETHSSTAFRRVVRLVPIYQTTLFWSAIGSVLFLAGGAIAGSRYLKYRIAIVNRYNPYIAGSPIRNEEMFFGRKQLVDRILRTLPNNSIMVFGPRRIGKTSLQYQLQRHLLEQQHPEYHFVPVFVDLQGVQEELFFSHLIEELREQADAGISQAISPPANGNKYGTREFANDLRRIINLLQEKRAALPSPESGKRIRLVLLIDEVDELNRYSERTNQNLRSIFMKSFSENLVAVLTGSNIRKAWQSESSPWYNFFEQIPMPSLSHEEALRLIHEPVTGFFRFQPQAAERIWEESQGRPFVIQKFCVRLVNAAIEKRRRVIFADDVNAIRDEVMQDTH